MTHPTPEQEAALTLDDCPANPFPPSTNLR